MNIKSVNLTSSYTFVRHGESVSNSQGLCCGRAVDSPLTPFGMQQASDLGVLLSKNEKPYDVIVHASLSRARVTAQMINKHLNLSMIEDARFDEHEVGEWEHKPWADVSSQWLARQDPPNGESWRDFYERTNDAVQDVLSRYSRPLVVSHGGVFLACLQNKSINLDFMPMNGTAYKFSHVESPARGWGVEFLCNKTGMWKSPSR